VILGLFDDVSQYFKIKQKKVKLKNNVRQY
jgi:hypothetical protein